MGVMLNEGIDIEKDYKKSIQYYKLASEKGSSDAMFNLGVLLMENEDL